MQKLFFLSMLSLLFLNCRDNKQLDNLGDRDTTEFNYQQLPERATINPEALEAVEAWKEFQDFNASIELLYRAKNNEDLILAIDDLIEKEKLLREGQYPEIFNTLQIKSRQQVIQTYLYKTKSHVLENQETTTPTVQMMQAYNALRKQLNIIVNSQLDKKLILDEA